MLICKIKANAFGQRIQNKGLLALFKGRDLFLRSQNVMQKCII